LQDVATLVEFMYSPILPNELSFSAFHRLYILADKFNMSGVLNKLLDHIQEKYATSGAIFDPKEIISIIAFALLAMETCGNTVVPRSLAPGNREWSSPLGRKSSSKHAITKMRC
jgi:hypothetical protein